MYKDRLHAGQELSLHLASYTFTSSVILAVPRGGVMVAKPVADRLNLPIEILITRKIGHPQNPEVAIGAVMPDGSAILDDFLIKHMEVDESYITESIQNEFSEIKRRMQLYTGSAQAPSVSGKTAVIIDDGIATGYTMKAAVQWLKQLSPGKLMIAVPVAPPDVVSEFEHLVDEFVCPLQPTPFLAVGMYYEKFPQNTDKEVLDVLRNTKKVSLELNADAGANSFQSGGVISQ